MSLRRPRALAALVLVLSVLGGCAAQNANLPPTEQANLQTDFANGNVMLSCKLGCGYTYGYHRQDMIALYDAGNWRGLATEVLTIGETGDQPWYYLGAAAEGLGYNDAAQRYYTLALIALPQCSKGINICDGLDLPTLTDQRLRTLDAKMLASPEFAQLAAPPSAPGTPTNVHLVPGNGLLKAPALIDGKIPLLFAVDSGCSGIAIPEGVAELMFDEGLLKKRDVMGIARATMANGSTAPVIVIHVAALQVGGVVLKNVVVGVTPGPGELLLGQSFLNRFKSWSIDNSRQALVLQPN
jgi:hypothetical protein